MEQRLKAIEICNNINYTLSKIVDAPRKIESRSSAYENVRPKVTVLEKQRDNLIQRFKINNEELKQF